MRKCQDIMMIIDIPMKRMNVILKLYGNATTAGTDAKNHLDSTKEVVVLAAAHMKRLEKLIVNLSRIAPLCLIGRQGGSVNDNHEKGEIMSEELLDFYYSAKQNAFAQEYKEAVGASFHPTKFKGQPYSECITHGKPPVGKWDDYQFLGTGTFDDCTFK